MGLVLLSAAVHAGKGTILPAPKKLSPHAYAWIGPYEGPSRQNNGYRMNLGFVVGTDAVAVVDTGYTPEMAEEMLGHIRAVTQAPVKYAINTNSQPHRFLGNEVFHRAGAVIIAQPLEKARMVRLADTFTSAVERILERPAGSVPTPHLPDLLVEREEVIDLGGTSIHIRHHGASHTPGSLVVHVPSDNIVFAGDILHNLVAGQADVVEHTCGTHLDEDRHLPVCCFPEFFDLDDHVIGSEKVGMPGWTSLVYPQRKIAL